MMIAPTISFGNLDPANTEYHACFYTIRLYEVFYLQARYFVYFNIERHAIHARINQSLSLLLMYTFVNFNLFGKLFLLFK